MRTKILAMFMVLTLIIALTINFTGCQSADSDNTETSTGVADTTGSTVEKATAETNVQATEEATATTSAERTITDMYDTSLIVPAEINRAISTGPVETQLLYMLAPEKLVGLSSDWNGDPSYIGEEYKSIPVIGNASDGSFNYEAAIAVNPEIVLEGKTKNIDKDREKFGSIPVVGVNAGDDLLAMYADEISYVANLLGVNESGDALLTYYQDAMDYVNNIVSGIPDSDKVRVYYAEGNDGLETDALGSWHTNLLAFCGGINVANVEVDNTSQPVQVSIEQIYSWNESDPIDLVIIGRGSQSTTYEAITGSDIWQELDCVKERKVFVRPDNPTSWFDGPPGYGQILGMYWMINILYPEETKDLDFTGKVREFYSKFLHYDLSEDEISALLADPS